MDDAVHKRPCKMKMQGQNQVKSLVLVYLIVLYRIRLKKIYALLVQCNAPFLKNHVISQSIILCTISSLQ